MVGSRGAGWCTAHRRSRPGAGPRLRHRLWLTGLTSRPYGPRTEVLGARCSAGSPGRGCSRPSTSLSDGFGSSTGDGPVGTTDGIGYSVVGADKWEEISEARGWLSDLGSLATAELEQVDTVVDGSVIRRPRRGGDRSTSRSTSHQATGRRARRSGVSRGASPRSTPGRVRRPSRATSTHCVRWVSSANLEMGSGRTAVWSLRSSRSEPMARSRRSTSPSPTERRITSEGARSRSGPAAHRTCVLVSVP